MTDLRVPKQRIAIDLRAPGGEHRSVDVFLSPCAPDRPGPERVEDVVARPDGFFPALDHATDRMTFVNRAGIAVVRFSRELDAGGTGEAGVPTEHEVEVTLLDGEIVRGVVSYALAPEQSRVVDFLNCPAPFFRLLVSPDAVLLVNKRHVARVALVHR